MPEPTMKNNSPSPKTTTESTMTVRLLDDEHPPGELFALHLSIGRASGILASGSKEQCFLRALHRAKDLRQKLTAMADANGIRIPPDLLP